MFSIFKSERKRNRRNAENWLHLAQRIYHYRRDLLRENELKELLGASHQVRDALKRNEDASSLRIKAERLEDAVRKYGGSHYRRSGWAENIEVILVAAILAIGIRTFFIQPFKIPTNSMWPTYHGMTHEIFAPHEAEPGSGAAAMRTVAFGASRRSLVAPRSGRVYVPVRAQNRQIRPEMPGRRVSSRRFLVLPGQAIEQTLYVEDTPVPFEVPLEFVMESVVHDAFFSESQSFAHAVAERVQAGDVRMAADGVALVATDFEVSAGDQILSFDILTGDQLFVDRMSYHFVRPKIGDGFVFRTEGIPGIATDKYYIKRLVGAAGDTLEIEEPVLLRNGDPIDNRRVFERIHEREGVYTGYVNHGNLSQGRVFTVPENAYYALGDNSANSSDSRDWGFVPQDQIVGRSLFIYYPFTSRWGPAQ